jgi:ABC-type iron transport system FetAB permease component
VLDRYVFDLDRLKLYFFHLLIMVIVSSHCWAYILKKFGGRFLFSWISQKYSIVVSISYDHGALESKTNLYLIGRVFLD